MQKKKNLRENEIKVYRPLVYFSKISLPHGIPATINTIVGKQISSSETGSSVWCISTCKLLKTWKKIFKVLRRNVVKTHNLALKLTDTKIHRVHFLFLYLIPCWDDRLTKVCKHTISFWGSRGVGYSPWNTDSMV